jgi:hypothetical protein
MSGFQLIADLTQSLAWPIAVLVAVIILRRPFVEVIARRPPHRVKAGPFEVEWERLLAETEKEIEGTTGVKRRDTGQRLPSVSEELAPVAEAAPAIAVREAYATVERELRRLVGDTGDAQMTRLGGVSLARLAESKGLLNSETTRSVEGLSVMRNLATHSSGREISPQDAAEYLALTDAVLYAIRQ